MLLTSFSFLLFFPVVFLLHYCVFHKNVRWQNVFILLASCIFYGCWDWRFLGLLMVTSLSTFVAGCYMEKDTNWQRRVALIGSIVINVGILFVFKYYNFFVEAFVDLFALCGIELNVSTLKILLPVCFRRTRCK